MTSNTECKTGQGESIHEVLRPLGSTLPDSPVLLAPNRQPLTWAALGAQLDMLVKSWQDWAWAAGTGSPWFCLTVLSWRRRS